MGWFRKPDPHEITIGGRRCLVYPAPYSSAGLLVAFHGLTHTPEILRDSSQLHEIGKKLNLTVVYPAGKFRYWKYWGTSTNNRDAQLFKLLVRNYAKDGRVFAAGFSAGAVFSHYLGVTYGDLLGGLILYAGGYSSAVPSSASTYPVLALKNSDDPFILSVTPQAAKNRKLTELVELYRQAGHPVDYHTLSEGGHHWLREADPLVYDFLAHNR